MWIKILKNYPGKDKQVPGLKGISVQASREYDLPDNTAKLLIKTRYAERTVAPWEKKLNPLQPQIDTYKKDMAWLEQQVVKQRTQLTNAQEIALTIPRQEQILFEMEQKLAKLNKSFIDFAAKNNIDIEKKQESAVDINVLKKMLENANATLEMTVNIAKTISFRKQKIQTLAAEITEAEKELAKKDNKNNETEIDKNTGTEDSAEDANDAAGQAVDAGQSE